MSVWTFEEYVAEILGATKMENFDLTREHTVMRQVKWNEKKMKCGGFCLARGWKEPFLLSHLHDS